ncbi:hypothetical protein ACPPVV_11710 [Rhodanobacter sp. Col0626]|uniref:hypothetical protein n=1 Tax=Rhodanobacter sp. Col0626 TaxID=3415679 RepID=UPI003CF026D7
MRNVLIVSLDNDTHPTCLSIDEKGNANCVKNNKNWQTIRWTLSGKAAHGSFKAQTRTKPGFAWAPFRKPPTGIFSDPVLRHGDTVLTLAVLNDYKGDPGSIQTKGEFIYQLSVTVDGKTYQSILKPGARVPKTRTTTNPRIKNT